MNLESEWHSRNEAPLAKTFHFVVRNYTDRGPCEVHEVKGAAYVTCGRDLARFNGNNLQVVSDFRSAPTNEDGIPKHVAGSYPDDIQVLFEPRESRERQSGSFDDFTDALYRTVYFHGGKWTAYPTGEWSRPLQKGKAFFVTPPVPRSEIDRAKPECADFSCASAVPRFIALDAETPDFGALKGRFAWAHEVGIPDYAAAVDPAGSVYVFMRALDLRTKKRVFGVARWAPGRGAQFDTLPAPLDGALKNLHTSSQFRVNVAPNVKAELEVTITTQSASRPGASPEETSVDYRVRFDGRSWSVSKAEAAKEVVEHHVSGRLVSGDIGEFKIEYSRNNAISRRNKTTGEYELLLQTEGDEDSALPSSQLNELGPSDVTSMLIGNVLRTIKPDEVLALTDPVGFLHPWPAEADDDCDHPLAVVDVLDEQLFEEMRRDARSGAPGVATWGLLPPSLAHVPIIESHVFGHVVLGASFKTVAEAKAFVKDAPSWNMSTLETDAYRGGYGVYCVHPINAKPFVR